MIKHRFRNFLKERAIFVNTTQITDAEVIQRIHLNFRLIFLRDTAAARWIDEDTYDLLMKARARPNFR